ncbi:Protein regulator of cytokinesis 1 [Portunus trituberculatus]|uniref:Protein regulator of cytokinesis 1 n=1 Tax=Portunus trituberculatus TaxID=210409 RepID=A0A5B7D529_PORTR|nr:Protein regulator of cytokinesis 1 [Portunus trituberculatus]
MQFLVCWSPLPLFTSQRVDSPGCLFLIGMFCILINNIDGKSLTQHTINRFPSPSSPSSPALPASPTRLHTSTQQQVQDTLTQLENLWDDLGLSEDQRRDRKRIFYGHISVSCLQVFECPFVCMRKSYWNLLEKIYMDERALKSRIVNQIEHNTIEIVKLCQELLIEPEDAVDGLTLLDLDAVMQERLEKLQQTKKERQETLRNLQEKDEGLCELLCEEPFYIPSDLTPSLEQLKAVEEHIRAMEELKDEREATYKKLKCGLLSFLEQLEQSPEDSFTREVVCSDDEDISLDQATIQRLRLDEELERVKVLRLHNLALFVEKMHKELTVWWDKCYVGQEEQDRIKAMTADDVGEDVLSLLEGEVERWKNYYNENEELLSTVNHFLSLFNHMLELRNRDKDPSRLFNTRGGALLQEEKAKKKVRNELPRVQKRLETLAVAWQKHNNTPFLVHGEELMTYLDHLWGTHEKQWEVEKAKRVHAKEGPGKPGRVVPQPKTPVASRKRGMDGEEPASSKRAKQLLPPPRNVSPTKRSPSKTPRGRPLAELNRAPPTYVPAMEDDASLQSITYDKFKADITEARRGAVVHSSILEEAITKPQFSQHPQNQGRRFRDALHLASPTKGSKRRPFLHSLSPMKSPALRRTTSQPCLGPNSPRFYSNRDRPLSLSTFYTNKAQMGSYEYLAEITWQVEVVYTRGATAWRESAVSSGDPCVSPFPSAPSSFSAFRHRQAGSNDGEYKDVTEVSSNSTSFIPCYESYFSVNLRELTRLASGSVGSRLEYM